MRSLTPERKNKTADTIGISQIRKHQAKLLKNGEKNFAMRKTLVVWRRFGKEHGEGSGFRLNAPEVISAHLQRKVEAFRQTPEDDWRWWQLSDEVIVEKPFADVGFGPSTLIYYLPRRDWAVVENASLPGGLGKEWSWYVHIGDLAYDPIYDCWVFTDFFSDVIIKEDKRTHSVLDLNELGKVFEMGLVTGTEVTRILTATQELIDLVRAGDFPPTELRGCQKMFSSFPCSALERTDAGA